MVSVKVGLVLLLALLEAGWSVVLTGRRKAALEARLKELQASGTAVGRR